MAVGKVQRGRFPVVRLNGRSLRFKARDVQDYIERRYSQAG